MWRVNCLGKKKICSSSFSSVQFSHSVVSTLCNPMNYSMPGLPVHHQYPESTQTHVHRVSNAIQPSHPHLSPSPPHLNLSQHQSLMKWVNSLHQVAKVLEFHLQHRSFQWIFRTDSCLENPMNSMKRQKIGHWKMNSPGHWCRICYWRSVEK